MNYGTSPEDLGIVDIECPEMMYYQYLPIIIPGQDMAIPANLEWIHPIIDKVLQAINLDSSMYIYATVKSMYCTPSTSNRPGWHSDGFGTNDLNFIWYDSMPTEFCIQDFELSPNHAISMIEMEDQAWDHNIETYPNKTLLGLDETVIHRCAVEAEPGFRTFIKISVSNDKYNLKGNSHNYLLDYNWDMKERQQERNHPIG